MRIKRKIDPLFNLSLQTSLDAINIGNILYHTFARAMVPPYFKDQSVPNI